MSSLLCIACILTIANVFACLPQMFVSITHFRNWLDVGRQLFMLSDIAFLRIRLALTATAKMTAAKISTIEWDITFLYVNGILELFQIWHKHAISKNYCWQFSTDWQSCVVYKARNAFILCMSIMVMARFLITFFGIHTFAGFMCLQSVVVICHIPKLNYPTYKKLP